MSQAPSDVEHPVVAAVRAAGAALDRACDGRLWQLGDDDVEAGLAAVLAVQARAGAIEAALLGEAKSRSLPARTRALSLERWLADRFRLSLADAGARHRQAVALAAQPAVGQALADAALTPEQATVIATMLDTVDAMGEVSELDRARAARFLIEQAQVLGPRELARTGAHLVEALTAAPSVDYPADAEAVAREHQAAEQAAQRAERNQLRFTPRPGGRSRTRLDLGQLGTAAMLAWFEAHADPPQPGCDGFEDQRLLPERRGDALIELLGQALDRPGTATPRADADLAPTGTDGPAVTELPWADPDQDDAHPHDADPDDADPDDADSDDADVDDSDEDGAEPDSADDLDRRAASDLDRPAAAGRRRRRKRKRSWVQIAVTIGLADLQAGLAGAGLLDTGGTLSAAEARRLACDAGIIPVVLAGPDQPLNVGRATKTWNPAQRRFIYARDRGCVAPGCDRPPAGCQIHHRWEWADGGPTDVENGALLCLYHHQQVHRQGWRVTMAPNGYPQLIPPASIDPDRRPRQHHRFRLTLLTNRQRT